MNVLVSVGIKDCRSNSVVEIPCAYKDAELIYKTFREVLEEDFSDYHSLCLSNPKLTEFQALITLLAKTLNKEDKLIIYFSGHGQLIENESLELLFNDAEDSGRDGRLSASRLKELLTGVSFQTILILDCCHAGAALNIANKPNVFSNNQISVLASSNAFQRAKFDDDGSVYTKTLCKVLQYLNETSRPISLYNIAEEIRGLGDPCYINTQDGLADVVLKKNTTVLIEDNQDFQKRFLMRINESDTTTREMHWYYLMDLPEMTKLQVLSNYLSEEIPSEPHWLVRRALGSLIGELKVYKHKEAILLSLLQSKNWMLQCIGLIGGRKDLNQEDIRTAVSKVFVDNLQIDAVWLANLYLADSEHSDINMALSTALSITSWGVLDIWVRYSQIMDKEDLLKRIEEVIKDRQLLEPLYIHRFFEDKYFNEENKSDLLNQIKSSELISFMYELKKRGETKSTKLKWLFSSLYGNWRDQMDLKLNEFFSNNSKQKVNMELELAADLPLVEMRMAIFQYMAIYNDVLEENFNSLRWGLRDNHPWVKRTAIRAFINYPELLEEAFTDSVDGNLYPGKLDFILEAISLGIDCKDFIKNQDLTANEKKSLEWAIDNALRQRRIFI